MLKTKVSAEMAVVRANGKAKGAKMTTKDKGKKRSRREPERHVKLPKGRDLSDEIMQDADEMADNSSANFLLGLNEKGMSQSRAETERIHRKEVRRQRLVERITKGKRAGGSDASSGTDSTDMEGASDESEEETDGAEKGFGSEDEQAHVTTLTQKKKRERLEEERQVAALRKKKLPIRAENGWESGSEPSGSDDEEKEIEEESSSRAIHQAISESEDEIDEEEEERKKRKRAAAMESRSTIVTGTRFGLRSPFEIFSQKKRSDRIRLARDQIARLSTDIINDAELSLGLVRRLVVFTQPTVKSPENGRSAKVDDMARASAILSLCAVFVDILPGYRIRELSESERAEKVNQELARRREFEQGLVKVYSDYLESLERIARSQDARALFTVSIKAMCTLAVKAIHFNNRTNLLRSLVSCLSRGAWDQSSDEAMDALVTVLKQDRQGDISLEVVRLLNRMIKERHFRVRGRVLDILRHLRLREELSQGKRANTLAVDGPRENNDVFNKKLRAKDIRKGKGEHLSKKEAKRRKEIKEIEAEMKEAEAEVDQEQRERHQTETLKLLFVLYFSVIKAESVREDLLIATMKGLTLFAHRISIDFFRDLLTVLRKHIGHALQGIDLTGGASQGSPKITLAVYCVVTALELLNGQGEALNVDLSDILADLYRIMLPLCLQSSVEEDRSDSVSFKVTTESNADAQLLLRALHLALVAAPVHSVPPERVAAFVGRMCICALHTPAKTTLALVQTAHVLLRRNDVLQSLLDNGEDRARNGAFDPANDQLEGLRPLQAGYVLWPLTTLQSSCHQGIRARVEAIVRDVNGQH